MVEGDSFVNISIFISLIGFSLSDLVEKISFLSPWHMLPFDFKSGVKGRAYFVGFCGCFY